jgi:hypothetical protein
MAESIQRRIGICRLDLTSRVLATEAATGAYAATAAAAAAAGAEVWAFAADSRHGTIADAERDVATLVDAINADLDRVTIVTDKAELPLERTDLVTNSGLLRPIDAPFIDRLPPDAIVALMYETWEARDGDIDYAAAAARGIRVIGVDEHHPACGAFEFVGDLVIAAVLRRRWPIRGVRFCVLSDNPFGEPVLSALKAQGAEVVLVDPAAAGMGLDSTADMVVVATTPAKSARNRRIVQTPSDVADFVIDSRAFACVQLWGDVDIDRLIAAGVMIEPEVTPEEGHQGIAMSEAGFEPVVRLQVAGMAAALHGADGPGQLIGLGQELVWTDT